MEHKHLIYYALNAQGENDIEFGTYPTENVEFISMPDEEFSYWYNGITDKLNQQFGLLIDEYESETVPYEILEEFMKALDSEEQMPTLYSAIREAIRLKTNLELDL